MENNRENKLTPEEKISKMELALSKAINFLNGTSKELAPHYMELVDAMNAEYHSPITEGLKTAEDFLEKKDIHKELVVFAVNIKDPTKDKAYFLEELLTEYSTLVLSKTISGYEGKVKELDELRNEKDAVLLTAMQAADSVGYYKEKMEQSLRLYECQNQNENVIASLKSEIERWKQEVELREGHVNAKDQIIQKLESEIARLKAPVDISGLMEKLNNEVSAAAVKSSGCPNEENHAHDCGCGSFEEGAEWAFDRFASYLRSPVKGDEVEWISVEQRPLIVHDQEDNDRWSTTKDGYGEFIAAIPYSDKNKPGKDLWWIHHCVIEDETGLCIVGDDGVNEPAGWNAEDITHYIPLPSPPTNQKSKGE